MKTTLSTAATWSALLLTLIQAPLTQEKGQEPPPPTPPAKTQPALELRPLADAAEGVQVMLFPLDKEINLHLEVELLQRPPLAEGDTESAWRSRQQARYCEQLLTDIRNWMEPAPDSSSDLRFVGSVLVAQLDMERMTWLQAFLRAQKQHPKSLHSIECRLMQADPKFLDEAGLTNAPNPLRWDENAASTLQLQVSAAVKEVIACPRVLAQAGKRVELKALNEIAYIQDYSLETVEPGPQQIAVPIIGRVSEGVEVAVRLVNLPEGQIGLEYEVGVHDLERPIATEQAQLSPDTDPVTVALPSLKSARLKSRVRMQANDRLLISGRQSQGVDRGRSFLMQKNDSGENLELLMLLKTELHSDAAAGKPQ